ncbi:MAG: AAA family ATPase [Spirochaetaceae bacterium]
MGHTDQNTSGAFDAASFRLTPEQVRFTITDSELGPINGEVPGFDIIGQPRALRALRMAVRIGAKGYNVFATGPAGTGKRTAIMRVLEEEARGVEHLRDVVYVYGFDREERPPVLCFRPGEARIFRDMITDLIRTLKELVQDLLERQAFKTEKDRILLSTEGWENRLVREFESRLADDGFVVEHASETEEGFAELYPIIDGDPVSFEELQRMLTAGKLDEDEWNEKREKYHQYMDELQAIYQKLQVNRQNMEQSLDELTLQTIDPDLKDAFAPLRERFTDKPVQQYLDHLFADVRMNLRYFLPDAPAKDEDENPALSRYHVNIVVDHSETKKPPIVFESNPDFPTLFGTQEPVPEGSHEHRSGFMMLRAGSLLRANGGYLVLRAEDLLEEEEAWITLKRALQESATDIRPTPMPFQPFGVGLKPEPVPLSVKVIVMGPDSIYDILYNTDEEVQKLFKVPAEFDSSMDRTPESVRQYTRFLQLTVREEGLLPLTPGGVAAIVEHGVRLTEFRAKLTTRFSAIADLLREADYFARHRDSDHEIDRAAVEAALRERQFLYSMPEEKIDEQIIGRELLIEVTGRSVGRINGLAIIDRGYYAFARPMLITARSSVGDDGIINIERESGLSGEIHDKGVYIIEGFLRSTYARNVPLSLRASIAFEQSYIEVDGDSASSSEVYALLSSITDIPLRQDIAVTGSVNQMGEVQPVGGISEKIEGFFEVCRRMGMTGEQGVIIPAGNIPNLIVSRDVQQAVDKGLFHIYAVHSIDEGLSILTGMTAGARKNDGSFEAGTVNARVQDSLLEMARNMKAFSDDS